VVNGRYAPEEALRRLLHGTGFKARRNGDQKYVVSPDQRSTGVIRGRLLGPAGHGAGGARVALVATRDRALTGENGEFEFPEVAPGPYRLIATADGFLSVQIEGIEVRAAQVVELPPQTLKRVDDPAQLAPFLVRERTTRRDPFDRSETWFAPRTAGSNLDLARTENDALPFNVYNRDQIARSGVVNLNEFLQREVLDADAVIRPPEQEMMQPTSLAGSTNLNLRGFGTDQTIILVNGRRLPEILTNGSSSQTPDVNFIPISLVQQVEVLPISAAALYSGNAVGGIINIVLRPGVDAQATELAFNYTNALAHYDASQMSASFLHSRSLLGGALRLRFNASVARATPPTEAELGFRQRRSFVDLPQSTSVYRGTPNIRSLALLPPGRDDAESNRDPPVPPPLFGPGSATLTSVAPGADGTGGLAAFRGREGVRTFAFLDSPGAFASSYDSIDYPYGRQQERTAYFGSVVYDIRPWLQLGFDGTYTHTVLHRGYDVIAADLRLRAESPFNPFGQEVAIALNEMVPQLGENHSEARLEFGAAVLSALLKLPREWQVLVDAQYGRNIAKYRGIAGANYARWQEMVDAGRYNPLRDTQVFGPPQEFYDRVLIHRGGVGRFVTLGGYSTIDLAFRATHHSIQLPTGTGALNIGADYRRNELARHNDERRFADGTLAMEPIRYGGRTLERYSVFGEMRAPLLPARWLPRFVRSLETDFAIRYLAANQAKEANLAPTFALKLQLPAGFALRGSVSSSSRFPTPLMSRLVTAGLTNTGTAGVDLRPVYDPVQNQTYAVQHEEVLDPDLRPEGAVTQTAGVLFRYSGRHRLRAALDYVDTRKENELIFLDVQSILNLEHLFPERVTRTVEPGPDGRVGVATSVTTGTINSAWRRSGNWSASLDYAWTEFCGGTLEGYSRLIYYTRYQHLLLRGANVVDALAYPEGASSNLVRYRVKFGGTWSNRHVGFGMDGHYFHSRVLPKVEWPSHGHDRIRPFWQFDTFAQGNLGRWVAWFPTRLSVQVRVNNVFASEYPRYANAASGAGVQAYGDWRGRVYSLSLTTTF
jgi:outer membrane receptor protein involved in Fe transport